MEILNKANPEKILENLKKTQIETNTQATNRIAEEMRNEKKLKERRDAVMNMYFEITGTPMTSAEFDIYNFCFNKAPAGWNIKSWIRDKENLIREYAEKKDVSFIKKENDENIPEQSQ